MVNPEVHAIPIEGPSDAVSSRNETIGHVLGDDPTGVGEGMVVEVATYHDGVLGVCLNVAMDGVGGRCPFGGGISQFCQQALIFCTCRVTLHVAMYNLTVLIAVSFRQVGGFQMVIDDDERVVANLEIPGDAAVRHRAVADTLRPQDGVAGVNADAVNDFF